MAKKEIPLQLNILLTAWHFPILGRATDQSFLWPIARGLANQGHKVTVISAKSPIGKPEVERDGVKVFYLHEGFPNSSNLPFQEAVYRKFVELHEKEPFHIVHSMDRSGFKIGRRRRHHKVAIAYDAEATQMSQVFSIMGMGQEDLGGVISTGIAVAYKFLTTFFSKDRALLRTADGVFVTNPRQRVALERYYLYPDYHIYTVPYGIDPSDLSLEPSTQDVRQKLGVSAQAKLILTISDMTEVHEIKNLLLAFEKLAIKKPNTYLVIVGSGPKQKDFEYEMLNLALGSRVFMPGGLKTEDMLDYISAADIYVNMSSRSTGFEPVVIEAMALKKIIIGSELSPISYIVEDTIDGFLLRPADVASLAQLLIDIINENIHVADMGQRARQKVIDLFDTKKMTLSILDAYKKILLRSGRF